MMALMSSGALKVSAKLYVECYTVFLFDIVQIKSEIKRISLLSVFSIVTVQHLLILLLIDNSIADMLYALSQTC